MIELKEAAGSPKKGYEIHHVVEQTAAEKAGYDRSKIDNRHNKVRIPTLKHRKITGWYSKPNERLGGVTPRKFLENKNWRERTEMGHYALHKFGVMK